MCAGEAHQLSQQTGQFQLQRAQTLLPEELANMRSERAYRAALAREDIARDVRQQMLQEQANAQIFGFVVSEAKKAGFDIDADEALADDFWNLAVAHVDRKMPAGSLEDKVKEVITVMRKLQGEPATRATPRGTAPSRSTTRSNTFKRSVGRDAAAGDPLALASPARRP
jgi:hypothetical protein